MAAAKPQNIEYMLRDGNGLTLLVKPSGRKLWHFEHIPPGLKNGPKSALAPTRLSPSQWREISGCNTGVYLCRA